MRVPAKIRRLIAKIGEAVSAVLAPIALPTPKAVPVRVRRRNGYR
jgi:hypothetical protein